MRIAAFTLVALLLPAASARAALTLKVEAPTFYPGERGFVEVFFTETAPAENERLVAYSVGLEMVGSPGITFGPAPLLREPTRHPFVFAPGTPIDDTGSGPTRIRSLVALPTGSADITDNAGVLRVPITIAPDAIFGQRGIVFNLTGGLTEFSNDIGEVIPFVPVNGFVDYIPEPSAACVAGLLGLGALARRRR